MSGRKEQAKTGGVRGVVVVAVPRAPPPPAPPAPPPRSVQRWPPVVGHCGRSVRLRRQAKRSPKRRGVEQAAAGRVERALSPADEPAVRRGSRRTTRAGPRMADGRPWKELPINDDTRRQPRLSVRGEEKTECGSGSVAWQGRPRSHCPPTDRDRRIICGWLCNGESRRRGRKRQATTPGQPPPRGGIVCDDPSSLLFLCGISSGLRQGRPRGVCSINDGRDKKTDDDGCGPVCLLASVPARWSGEGEEVGGGKGATATRAEQANHPRRTAGRKGVAGCAGRPRTAPADWPAGIRVAGQGAAGPALASVPLSPLSSAAKQATTTTNGRARDETRDPRWCVGRRQAGNNRPPAGLLPVTGQARHTGMDDDDGGACGWPAPAERQHRARPIDPRQTNRRQRRRGEGGGATAPPTDVRPPHGIPYVCVPVSSGRAAPRSAGARPSALLSEEGKPKAPHQARTTACG